MAKLKVQEAQSAYVPDKDVAKTYIGRKINGHQDFSLLDYAMQNSVNVLLSGDTGSGKTMVGEAYASKRGLYYYSLPCDVSVDPTSLFGKVTPTKQAGVFEWVDGPVTSIVRNGGVLNISEINYMSPRVAASLYPLLDRRRYIPLLGNHGEIVRAHDDLLVVADMNPNYRGTVDINAAFLNRFPLKLKWGYDTQVENKILTMKTLKEIAKKLRSKFGDELDTPVSTNMLADFEKFARDLGVDFAVMNFVSAFNDSERHAVDQVIALSMSDLKREVSESDNVSTAEDEEFEDIEDEFEDVDEFEWEHDI